MPRKTKESVINVSHSFTELAEAALMADFTEIRRVCNRVARALAEEGDEANAMKLRSILRKKSVPLRSSGYMESLPIDAKSRAPLVEELDWPEDPVFLSEDNSILFECFVNDVQNMAKLSKEGLAAMPRLLLSGPPGTGKTLLATHVASQLRIPIYLVRLDSLISSFLGETAKNIRSVFDFISNKNAVLLIDEIDAVAKMRDDGQELGELKRVVNTLIQGLDSLDECSIVVGATNHAILLDSAIWRRFPYKAELPLPDTSLREVLWSYYLFKDKSNSDSLLLGKISKGMSCSDIMEAAYSERRRAILSSSEVDLSRLTLSILNRLVNNKKSYTVPHAVTNEEKREGIISLAGKGLQKQEIAALLKVARQTVYKYLKEQDCDR